ncbi:hypothetical protein AQPW35_20230 [Rubrivivax pictus]|uniref:Uncharacterized protein n=1 Tax=Pseudaquabacterium pictum TaxID=2315236 RepID=A0A480ASA2_9BURK|nr:hypothetical protein AQPW35_20230 [Rubrivivax pictus]
MQAVGRTPQRAPDGAPPHYERHRPKQTTLYRLVQKHAAGFIAHTEACRLGGGSRRACDIAEAALQVVKGKAG